MVQNRDFFRFLRRIGSQGGGKNSKIINPIGDSMDISLKPMCTNFGEIPTNCQVSNLSGANFVDFVTVPVDLQGKCMHFLSKLIDFHRISPTGAPERLESP